MLYSFVIHPLWGEWIYFGEGGLADSQLGRAGVMQLSQ